MRKVHCHGDLRHGSRTNTLIEAVAPVGSLSGNGTTGSKYEYVPVGFWLALVRKMW